MTRDEGYALVSLLADEGFSSTLSIGIHERMSPREHVSVTTHSIRFEAIKLRRLLDICDEHGFELHLIGNELRFLEKRAAGENLR